MNLEEMRGKIDAIDKELISLFEQRFAISREVANFKISVGKEILDKEREQVKIESVKKLINDQQDKEIIEELFGQIMDLSRKVQYRIIVENEQRIPVEYYQVKEIDKVHSVVVYQGVPGAYSHEAVQNYFGSHAKTIHVPYFKDAIQAVLEETADYAVLPIANSSAGIVSEIYDLLIMNESFIIDEISVPVSHSLVGLQDALLEDIDVVYSHPQALSQCRGFLEKHREWNCMSWSNTASSAKKISEDGRINQAAIASPWAAKLYGLKVLQEGINQFDVNTTKFIIVGKIPCFREDAGKVMVSFELSHESGSLYKALSHFIFNRLNMTKIESRPVPEKKWEYRFFVEFEGNLEDIRVKTALKGIREEALGCRLIGNY